MEKLQKNHHYEISNKTERIQITIENIDLYIIKTNEGIIIDAYGNHPTLQKTGDDFLNTFTVWYDDAYVNEEE